ncbi:DUF721 domain-containing protein [Pseudemcibacter aquimaris]|uniref:DUF721 domain-containing protein n=1 Tax=Pseudemcibacter aquimaris TaxID=2857064 RepID=UPI002011320C|nr:DciA family protein [Pseudemcibacter aquimaris]MCC3862454.1 DciA family protein [Pseudemcibacter aquimaris]WDU59118.1 DUF721 domain-containing protein [Pseudemcibacter aquimaris]
MSDEKKIKRTYKTLSIAELAQGIQGRAFRRFGFAKSDIHMHWAEIVGPVLSKSSIPQRLVRPKSQEENANNVGTLHIRVEGSYALEMQHLEHLVIDRINSYFGFKAVDRLVFHHGNVEKQDVATKYSEPILSDSQKNALEMTLKDVKDDELRKSLYKVGAEILGQQERKKPKQAKRFTRRGMGSTKTK